MIVLGNPPLEKKFIISCKIFLIELLSTCCYNWFPSYQTLKDSKNKLDRNFP